MIARHWWLAASALSGLAATGTANAESPAQAGEALAQATDAQRIGVAAAIVPDTKGGPAGQALKTIVVGSDLVRDQVIETDANGRAQILFLDQSSLTLGPNSRVVLDRFVYDPATDTGTQTMTATKGIFRYVGGRLSKRNEVRIATPVAVIGVRGGIAWLGVGPEELLAVFIAGLQMNILSLSGETLTVVPPGYLSSMSAGQRPSSPLATPERVHQLFHGMEKGDIPATLIYAIVKALADPRPFEGQFGTLGFLLNILDKQSGVTGSDQGSAATRQILDAILNRRSTTGS